MQVTGTVQGVGFRPHVYRLATGLGLSGFVVNEPGGVTIEAEGPPEALAALRLRLRAEAPRLARIEPVTDRAIPVAGGEDFEILHSRAGGPASVPISPDVATCEMCSAEIDDPAERRFRYPFTNCTDCGPRFTITTGIPYDRPNTTMRAFEMCARCQAEYDDPADRRFHAQPIACPRCGPELSLLTSAAGVAGAPRHHRGHARKKRWRRARQDADGALRRGSREDHVGVGRVGRAWTRDP